MTEKLIIENACAIVKTTMVIPRGEYIPSQVKMSKIVTMYKCEAIALEAYRVLVPETTIEDKYIVVINYKFIRNITSVHITWEQ